MNAASIVTDASPPVCDAEYVSSNWSATTPREAHVPTADRGSVGIHPFSRPSWYDHNGDCTVFVVLELPIWSESDMSMS